LLDEAWIAEALSEELGAPIAVAVAYGPADVDALSGTERRRYADLVGTPRCDSWLRGRAALKRLLVGIGDPPDTSALVFPHLRVSLTHCGRYAVAVALEGRGSGLGVDLEIRRSLPAEAARFFLSRGERELLPDPEGPALLRLWTVKEAVFKADPGNSGRGLLDYQVADPTVRRGEACLGRDPAMLIRYASLPVQGGFLTAAVATSAGTQKPARPVRSADSEPRRVGVLGERVEGQAHRGRVWP